MSGFVLIDDRPLWTLWIELRGWVMLGDKIGVSDSVDSITSTFDVAVAALLHDDKYVEDRVVSDSRVRFRLGDECNEDEAVDVM